jgi:hypothetical protein
MILWVFNFTDDRDVLVVKPEEVIVHTAIYDDKKIRKLAKEVIRYSIGDLTGTIAIVSRFSM